jgi:hypothetical protein
LTNLSRPRENLKPRNYEAFMDISDREVARLQTENEEKGGEGKFCAPRRRGNKTPRKKKMRHSWRTTGKG